MEPHEPSILGLPCGKMRDAAKLSVAAAAAKLSGFLYISAWLSERNLDAFN